MATRTTRRSRPHALSDRATASLIGVLYIVGTIAGILGLAAAGGGTIEGPDYVADAAALGKGLPTGAALTLVMGVALASIPVVAFPVLRETSRRLALGYLVFRGALETIGYIVTATSWLVFFQLGRDYDAADADGLRGAGAALANTVDVSGSVTTIFFLAGAAAFYWVLYRSSLVPRWLSGWGLVAIAPYLVGAVLVMYALIEPLGATEVALDVPLGLQEMVLAVWLIVRGFNREASPGPTPAAGDKPA